jgi:hypothetical protein
MLATVVGDGEVEFDEAVPWLRVRETIGWLGGILYVRHDELIVARRDGLTQASGGLIRPKTTASQGPDSDGRQS